MATRPDSPVPVPMLDDDPYDGLRVRVLHLGPEFSYRVPSFLVLTVELRQATMQIERVMVKLLFSVVMDSFEVMLSWTELYVPCCSLYLAAA